MDSIVGFDPTLPIDLDGSANPDLLPEVTFGNHLEYQDGSIPMVTKQSNGRMSPIRARTMKEYDQQIAELKKENFSLKLRIYFLEERMQQKFGDGEDVFKTNIELKVQVESLKKELLDKHELLKKASTAMESLTTNHEMELSQIRSQIEQEKRRESSSLASQLSDAQQKIRHLEEEMEGLAVDLQKAQGMENKHTTELGELKQLLDKKEKEVNELTAELDAESGQRNTLTAKLAEKDGRMEELQTRLDQLQKDLDRKDRDMDQLSSALKDVKAVESSSFLAQNHLQDQVDDQRESLDKLQIKLGALQQTLGDKDGTIGKLEDALRDKDKKNKDQENQLRQLEKDLAKLEENSIKRDKTIQGLVVALHEKNKQTSTLEDHLQKSEAEMKKLRDDLHEARMARHQAEETLQCDKEDRDIKLARLQQNLRENELQLENLMRALGKKDGELGNFKDLLGKAEDALRKSETAVESLQEQLQKERDEAQDRLEGQGQHYKRLLDDAQNELKLKGDLLRTVEDRLKDKDKQLQEYVGLLTDDGQVGIADLHKSITEKNQELRGLRQKLAGHDQEVDDLKQQLQLAEEALDAVDQENQAKDEHIRQLTGKLRTAQQELEAAVDGQTWAVEDRKRAVKHLETLLADKDAALQDALEYNTGDGSRLKLLRDQLREKDKLLEELMAEKNRTVLDSDRAHRDLINKLKEKNDSTDDMKLYRLLEEQLQEIRHLSELLMKEKQIFITLNQDSGGGGIGGGSGGGSSRPSDINQDRSAAFLTELGAVQALRQQLQEGVERNNNLRLVLEHQITGQAPAPTPAPAPAPPPAPSLGSYPGGYQQTQDKEHSQSEYNRHQPPPYRPQYSPEQSNVTRARPDLVDVQTSPVHHGLSPGESGYHDITDAQTSPVRCVNTHDRSVLAVVDTDYRGIQCSPVSDRNLLPDGQTASYPVSTNSPKSESHSVQTSPFRVSTHNRSTITSPHCQYQTVQTSPISLGRNLSPGIRTPSSGSENNLTIHRSPSAHYNEAQTSPIASLNNLASPGDTLSSGLGTAPASGIDPDSLSRMSSTMLRKLVQQLQEDLVGALKQNHELQDQVFGGECETRQIPGRNETDPTVADFQHMQEKIDELRASLDRREKENEVLRSHLGLDQNARLDSRNLPYVNDLQNELQRMGSQLKDVLQANELLMNQINLNSKSKDYPSGFNPSLIIDMAREIEALKSELEKSRKIIAEHKQVTFGNCKQRTGKSLWTDDVDTSGLGNIDGASNSSEVHSAVSGSSSGQSVKRHGGRTSQIPRPKTRQPMTSNSNHESHPLILHRQLRDAQDHIKQLETTLAATEETVRYQSQKVKYYRGLLKDAGIVPLQDSRSQSETCLTRLSGNKSWHGSVENLAGMRNSQDGLSPLRTVSLETVRDYGNTDNVYELKHQIKDMQSKLEKSFALVHRYRSASPSGGSERGVNSARRSLSPSVNHRRSQSTDSVSQLCQMSGNLEKLQKQVRSLESELQESRKLNTELQDKLQDLQSYHPAGSNKTNPGYIPNSSRLSDAGLLSKEIDGYRHEISSLRKQLLDSQNVNTLLRDELEELSHFLSELMVHDQNGHTSDVGMADISSLRQKLNQSLDVLRTTSSDLSLCEPQPVRGSGSGIVCGSALASVVDVNLNDKYKEALHSNQELRKQLAQLQEMYQSDLHNKSLEIRQLQHISERFQQEMEASGKLKRNGEADGSPVAGKRLSGRKKTETESLDSSSPCDGVPPSSFTHLTPVLSRVSAHLCKSGSMESDDITDVYKQTDENYGRPVKDSSEDTSMERQRHRTGSGSPHREGLGLESQEESLDRLRHRMSSGATTNTRPSVDGHYTKDISVFSSPKMLTHSPDVPERLSFQRKVSDRDSVDFPMYSNQSLGLRFCDMSLNPSLEDRAEEARDLMDSSGTASKKSTFKLSDYDSELVSSWERSQTPLADVSQLQARLGAMEDLNKTLKDELSIYETLCKSVGIQNTPVKPQVEKRLSSGKGDMDSLTLREHLAEIRAMRQKLEQGLDQSDKMREELLNKLQTAGGNRMYIHQECDQKLHELELTIKQLQQELIGKQTDISEKIYIIDEREKIIQDTKVIIERQRKEAADKEVVIERLREDLTDTQEVLEKHQREMSEKERTIAEREKTISEREQTINERDHQCQRLLQKKEKMEAMLKKASKEIKRLNLEVGDLREQADEKAELNKTLRLELSVYEKLNGEQQENDEKSCIRELLTEVRRLRVQLERSIDANDTLRGKLEEILRQQLQQQQHQNNSPACSHTTDAPDGRPSPESTFRPPEKTESKTKETYIRKFRSEKEYNYNVITREAGLHGEADHVYSDFTSTTESHSGTTQPTRGSSTDKHNFSNTSSKEVHMSHSLPVPPGDVTHGSSMMSLPDDIGHLSRRRHLASVENLKYWVDSHPSEAMKDFPIVRVDSDIRRLFAIGKLDDFEKLRKENNESVSTLCGIQARVSERLKTLKSLSTSENLEYSTLKELNMSTENLRICLEEEHRLIAAFWVSQLPPINELGEFFDPKMASENDELKRNLVHLRSKYDLLKHQVREADHRLQATNRQRENVEQVLYKQLSKTYKVLQKAGSNMEKSAKESGLKIPPTKR